MAKRKNTSSAIEVQFWGVRGSIATPQMQNIRYGGHTACVSIRFKNRLYVCDAGTGIRVLGHEVAKTRIPVAIFLSHLHWDHIFGLPFFKPLYQHNRKIFLAGPSYGKNSFKSLLGHIMCPPYFPVGPVEWNSHVQWRNLGAEHFFLGPVRIETKWVCHPDKTLGFQFFFPGGKRIVYVTDQELNLKDKKFAHWIQGADLLIHDAQYDKKEYETKRGWGHSPYEVVLEVAHRSNIGKLILFHHDPNTSDRLLEKRFKLAKALLRRRQSRMKCLLAKEGLKIWL